MPTRQTKSQIVQFRTHASADQEAAAVFHGRGIGAERRIGIGGKYCIDFALPSSGHQRFNRGRARIERRGLRLNEAAVLWRIATTQPNRSWERTLSNAQRTTLGRLLGDGVVQLDNGQPARPCFDRA